MRETPMRETPHDETRDFLVDLLPIQKRPLLHLLDCEECKAFAVWAHTSVPTPVMDEYGPAMDWVEIEEKAAGLMRNVSHQKTEADAWVAELMATPAGERAQAVKRLEKLRQPLVARRILEQGRALLARDVREAEEMARLGLAVAAACADRPAGPSGIRIDDLKAHACSLLGDALRRRRLWREAEEAFQAAASYLTGPLSSDERAVYCRRLALLRLEQGRFDEASGLLARAAGLFSDHGMLEAEADCWTVLGLLLLEEGEPEEALEPLGNAADKVSLDRSPRQAVQAGLALALAKAELGQVTSARRLVERCRTRYGRIDDLEALLRVSWLEGRVASALGERARAVEILREVRQRFLERGSLLDAALATFDLALLLAEGERNTEIPELMDEIARSAPEQDARVGRVLLALAAFARAAAERRPDLPEVAAASVRILRRSERRGLIFLSEVSTVV